jgi:hypothetical protein
MNAKLSVMAQPKERRVKLYFVRQDGSRSCPDTVDDRKGDPKLVQQHSDHPDGFRIVWNTHVNDHRMSVRWRCAILGQRLSHRDFLVYVAVAVTALPRTATVADAKLRDIKGAFEPFFKPFLSIFERVLNPPKLLGYDGGTSGA